MKVISIFVNHNIIDWKCAYQNWKIQIFAFYSMASERIIWKSLLALFKLKNSLIVQFSSGTVIQYRQTNLRFFHIGGIMVFYWRIYYFEEIQLLLTYSCKVIVACFIDSFYDHMWFDQTSIISKIQFLFDHTVSHPFPFIQFKTPEETVVPGTIYLNLKQHLCVTTKKVSRCLYLRIKRTPISCRNIFCWGREWYIDVMPGHGWTPTSEVDDLNSLS